VKGKITKVGLAREYRKKYGMEMPTLKLARIMYNENNIMFKDIDDARWSLRYIEGKVGKQNKNKVAEKQFIMEKARPLNPYNIPESDEIPFNPFIIKGYKRIGVISDIHLPYHSITALTAAIDFCKKDKIDALLLNGDVLDCFQLSRFVKDPRKRNFAGELEQFEELMNIFEKQLKCQMFFKYGNHSERYEAFLFQKAKELIGVEEFDLDNIIKSRANGIKIIKDKRIIKVAGLNIIHGHEYTQGVFNPVNVARGLFLRGKTSAMQSHSHQTSEHTESDMNGKITTTWSIGCTCSLSPEYSPLNKWNHGFAIIDTDGKTFDVRNKRIVNGKVL
jgi:predicted phosphodiesterase